MPENETEFDFIITPTETGRCSIEARTPEAFAFAADAGGTLHSVDLDILPIFLRLFKRSGFTFCLAGTISAPDATKTEN